MFISKNDIKKTTNKQLNKKQNKNNKNSVCER